MLVNPKHALALLQKGINDCGLDGNDVDVLQRMVACAAEENQIVLPEDVWVKIKDETDPEILLFLFFLFNKKFHYLPYAERQAFIQNIIVKLPEIRQEWEKTKV